MRQQKQNFKIFMNKYQIKEENLPPHPYSKRIQVMAGLPNSYINYRKDRLKVLEDRGYNIDEGEPYHLTMLREQ